MRRTLQATLQQIRCYSSPTDRAIPAAKQKYVPTSGTYPKGFLAGTSHAGVKASNTKNDDITMVVSEKPCTATGVFTQNIFKAAPVHFSKWTLHETAGKEMRGVIVNSGCANAVTGKVGQQHAAIMARATDKCFGEETEVDREPFTEPAPKTLVMSTGVIGQRLPIDKIEAAIPKAHKALGSEHQHWLRAAQAICTTDTFPKLLSRTFTLPSHPDTEYRIAGMTKGAGMIHPNMGTLLGIVCTDAKVTRRALHDALLAATARSFNQISIDGDTSTNDTVVLLANGAAAPEKAAPVLTKKRAPGEKSLSPSASEDSEAFTRVLTEIMQDLAKLVVRDGEGATKFVTIRVQSLAGYNLARRAAVSIARSSLVKTALYGKDANWGRILCAIGYAPGIMKTPELDLYEKSVHVKPHRTSVSFIPADGSEPLHLLVRGEPEQVDEARAKQILEMEDLEILVQLDDGPPPPLQNGRDREMAEAVYWTCDLSHEYVTINGDYRT
jgi:glutamate N-acetyltransferase / amino-acid N-acetyltransferase